ncbi:MAG: N-6 DNA methylase [Chloroflexi bacterium]|nr:N-6 DNA methylase [Chloroflexota bacterium]
MEQAITALGKGFLAHPANGELRKALQDGPASGGLDTQEYYRQLLRLVYRLLFLFVAEDRDVLLDPNAEPAARERYTSYYSTARLRRLADRRVGTRHHDLYQGLRLVMAKLGDAGSPPLGLPALGGYLFSIEAVRDLADREIANHDLLDAIRALAFVEDGRNRRLVDYRNLGAEELGSVYESLLELHPEIDSEAATFALKTASGNERKTTGSYYTPTSLIQCLLDSALDPVLEEAAAKPDPEAAILDLKVCDPACGSGHFLIAAAHRVAKRLAAIRTGEPEPSPEAVRTALRQVVGSCIYGVDLNPMAVELCKVSLWMEAVEPGKPLTFLDHHIQSGNSLLGTTPALLAQGIPDAAFTPIEGDDKAFCSEFRKKNKQERAGQTTMFDADLKPWEHMGNLATAMLALDGEDADTIEGQRRKQERYEQMVRSDDYLYGRLLADAWCAAFVWKKAKTPDLPYPITDERLREIERSPFRVATWMRDEIWRLAEQYQFFHWHLAFPDVFRAPRQGETPENEQVGWRDGFDVVLGNPPWERVKLADREFFASRRPDIANAANASIRKRLIEALKTEAPTLHDAYIDAFRQADAESLFVRASGRYPLTGRGHINTYIAFTETMRMAIGPRGRFGVIVPTGLVTDDATKALFQDLVSQQSLVSYYGFKNEEHLFPLPVEHTVTFGLLTAVGQSRRSSSMEFCWLAYNTSHLRDSLRRFFLTEAEIRSINPNTQTCPVFRSRIDADIVIRLHATIPVLEEERSNSSPWSANLTRMLHMSDDSGLFRNTRADGLVPLYEAKLFHQYNHRFGTYAGRSDDSGGNELPKSTVEALRDPSYAGQPRYWVAPADVENRMRDRWSRGWLISFRDIARSTDERTAIFTILPRVGVGHTAPLVLPETSPWTVPALLAALNSYVLDYVARQKVGGTHLTYGYLRQFPVLPPEAFDRTLLSWIVPRVLELTYTAWDLEPFARDVGYDGPPFRWDEDRRFLLRAELDALYFRLYGIERDDVDYIMETFPIVKRRDEQRHGEYRTKRMILEIFDALTEADRTGVPYQTRLDPPPADPRVAHPNRDGTPYTGLGWQLPVNNGATSRQPTERPSAAAASAAIATAASAQVAARADGAPMEDRVAASDAPSRRAAVTRLPSQPTLLDRDPLFAEVKAEPPARPPSRPSQTRLSSQPPLLDRDPLFAAPTSDEVAPSETPVNPPGHKDRAGLKDAKTSPLAEDSDAADASSLDQFPDWWWDHYQRPEPGDDEAVLYMERELDALKAHVEHLHRIEESNRTPSTDPATEERHLRQHVLDDAIAALEKFGPLTGREMAKILSECDARIDRKLVNSVLHREGAANVRYDAARYTYTLRQKSRE